MSGVVVGGESVRVVVKCRPMNQRERGLKCDYVVTIDCNRAECTISNPCDRSAPPKTFTFDGAYGPDSTNEQIYADVAFPLVDGVTEGYNGTVFAYGQTGCGKTYTMQGCIDPPEQRGVVPRAFIQIFDTASVADSKTRYLIRASYLEIYNEEIRDLLGRDTKVKLELREHPDGAVFVKDLTMHTVFGVRDCEQVMERGWKHRSTGATLMNVNSSRSHSIFTIYVERCDEGSAKSAGSPRGNSDSRIRASKLNLVDLAGSERQSKTGATGDRQREATKINLSLSALGNVISALVDGRSKHIPYRDSKLTRLLQDSLGGNTKTLMIACLSPAADSYDETLSTLRYANRAKNIRNRPTINEDPKDAIIRQYIDEINRLKAMLCGDVPMELQQQRSVAAVQTPTQATVNLEPKIVEKIVRVEIPVVDETQIAARTNQVVEDYETRMRHLAAELAEAHAGRQRTADEMARLRAESEASQRRLRDQLAERAEKERRTMRDDFQRETGRLRTELEAACASRDAVQSEADGLRERFSAEMRRVEGSVPAERVEEEKRRLVEEYEQRMCRIQSELEAVRNSRRQVDEEMARLQAAYEAKIDALQATVAQQTAAEQPDINHRPRTDDVNGKDDEEWVKKSAPSNKEGDISGGQKGTFRCERTVQSVETTLNAEGFVTYDKTEDRERCHDQSPAAANVGQEVSSSTADVLVVLHQPYVSYRSAASASKHQVDTDFDSSMNRMTSNLEAIRRMHDNLISMAAAVKIDYQNAVHVAQRTFTAGDRFEFERKKIKAEFDVQMELVKDDVEKLNATRHIVKRQMDEKRHIRDCYVAEIMSMDSQVESETADEETAVTEVKSSTDKYFELSRQLEMRTADEKENAEARIIDAKYERENRRIGEALQAGTLSDQVAREMLEQLNTDRLVELTRARDRAIQSTITPVVEDLDVDDLDTQSYQIPRPATSDDSSNSQLLQQELATDVNRHEILLRPALSSSNSCDGKPEVKQSETVTDSSDGETDMSSQPNFREIKTSAEVTRRLKELEKAMIVGGGDCGRTADGGTTSAERRKSEIRERLRRQKRNAEDKQYRLQQAQQLLPDTELVTPSDVVQDAGEDGRRRLEGIIPLKASSAKTVETLRTKCKALEREIRDLHSEFELERMDFLDTVRNQDQTVLWYEAVIDKMLPALRRDVNYADLEKIRSQSRWDDLNHTWIVPPFEFDRRLSLPRLTAMTVGSSLSPTLIAAPTLTSSSDGSRACSATPVLDPITYYELRSEDRFLQRLNESVQRDPAASYFRTGNRADQLMMLFAGSNVSPATPQHQRQVATPNDTTEFRGGSSSSSSSSSASGSRVSSCSTSVGGGVLRFGNKIGTPTRLNVAPVNTQAAGCLLPGRQRSNTKTLPRPFK